MKVKNMISDYQSVYISKLSYKKKKITGGLFLCGVALLFALLAAISSSVAFLRILFSVLSLILSGGEIVSRLTKKKKFDDAVFVLLAVLVLFFVGEFVLSAIAMVLYKLMSLVIVYVSGSLGLQLRNTVDVLPRYANFVDQDGTIRQVYSKTLAHDAKIMVKNGETVPVDCVIEDGFSEFDVTNVSFAEEKVSLSAGDKALAGYVNCGSSVTCRTICDYDDSLVQDMNRLTTRAEKEGTKSEKRFLAIAKWYPAAVLMLAIAMILIAGFSTGAWVETMPRAAVMFIVATTGSYVVAVPLLSACAVWNLKKKGLALTAGDMIEEIADINCIAFEKNGILTDGLYTIKEVYTAEGITEEDFLMIAGNCLGGRPHPISKLLTKYKNAHIPVENVMEFPGKGLECTIMGKAFLCGSETFMQECSVDVSAAPGKTLYISIDGVVMGGMTCSDALKHNTGEKLRALRAIGVEKVVMFTNERKETAALISKDCGADNYYAELTPYARGEIIQKLRKKTDATVAYVGDALLGTQALDTADVGITLANKESKGLEDAKATLLGDLSVLAEAIEISRLTCGKVELHFYCATAVKMILTLLGLFGAVNIAAAIVVEAFLTLIALFSAKDLLKK